MKKHPEHKIDELLQRSLHDLQGETSVDDWTEIQRRLQEDKKRQFIGWKLILPLVLLLLSASAGILFQVNRASSGNLAKQQAVNTKSHISIAERMPYARESELDKSNEKAGSKEQKSADEIKESTFKNRKTSNTNQQNSTISSANTSISASKNSNSKLNDKITNERNIIDGKKSSEEFNLPNENIESPAVTNAEVEDTSNNISEINKENLSVEQQLNDIEKKSAQKKIKLFTPNGDKRFIVGFSISPDATGSSAELTTNSEEQIHKNYFSIGQGQSNPAGGINAGIFLQYNIWKGLNFQSGLRYNRRFEKVNYNYYNNEIPVIDSASRNILGYIQIDDTTGTSFTGRNEYSFVSVPFLIGYEGKISKKISLAFRAGGSAMILLNASGKYIRPDDLTLEDTDIENLRKMNWTLNFSPAIYYNINKSISVGLEPNWQFFQKPVQRNEAMVSKTFSSVGLGFSLRFSPF